MDRTNRPDAATETPRWPARVAALALSVTTVVIAVKLDRYWRRLGKEIDPLESARGKVSDMRQRYEHQSVIAREISETLREITGRRLA